MLENVAGLYVYFLYNHFLISMQINTFDNLSKVMTRKQCEMHKQSDMRATACLAPFVG